MVGWCCVVRGHENPEQQDAIPAKAGIQQVAGQQGHMISWIRAFAGMTAMWGSSGAGYIFRCAFRGMTDFLCHDPRGNDAFRRETEPALAITPGNGQRAEPENHRTVYECGGALPAPNNFSGPEDAVGPIRQACRPATGPGLLCT